MPKLQAIVAVPNIDSFNAGVSNPAKIFPSRPSVLPNALYEVQVPRSSSAPPIPTASLPMMARIPKTKYLNDFMTVDTKSLVHQKINIERPMSAMSSMSSLADSPTSDSGTAGKTSSGLRLVTNQGGGERSASTTSGEGDTLEGTRVSSRRSTSEYSRVGMGEGSTGRAPTRGKRKSAIFDDEELVERPRRKASPAPDVVKPEPKKYGRLSVIGFRKRVVTVGILWTTEELEKLDALLIKYPETKVQSHRHQQIADELGSRNVKQVASKLQKYKRSGKLDSPGNPIPFITFENEIKSSSVSQYETSDPVNLSRNRVSGSRLLRNPTVRMKETFRGGVTPVDEAVDEETRATPEYKELARLQRIVKEREEMEGGNRVVHHGFKCDKCGSEPILGTRVSCANCPVDLCLGCYSDGFTNGME